MSSPLRTAARRSLLLLTIACSATSVLAQRAPAPVSIGTRVRIYAPSLRSDPYTGRVASVRGDTVVLDTAGERTRLGFDMGPVLVDQYRRVTIPLSTVEAVEVSAGRSHVRPALKGAVLGGLALGLINGLQSGSQINPTLKQIASGVPSGAIVGAILGGTIGYLLGSERWVPGQRPTGGGDRR